MGLFQSKDEEEVAAQVRLNNELRENHEREMRREADNREIEEREEKERIQKEMAAREKKQKEQREWEIKEATASNLKITQEKVKNYNAAKEAGEKRLLELTKQIEQENEKKIAEKKEEGIRKVTDVKNSNMKGNEKLVEQRKQIDEELNNLSADKEKAIITRNEMKKEMEKEEKMKMKQHQEEIKNVQEKSFQAVAEGEKQMNEIVDQHKQFQNEIMTETKNLQALQMTHSFQLLDAHDKEQVFENFRREGRHLIFLFNRYKRNFGEQESDLIFTRDQINQQIPLTGIPDLNSAADSLRELSGRLQELNCYGAMDQNKYEALRDDVIALVNQLATNQSDIVSRINGYQNACRMQSPPPQTRRQKTPQPTKTKLESMTNSEDEEFDVLDTNSVKSSSTSSIVIPVDVSNNFTITDHCKTNQDLITQISKLMLEFNVRAPTIFNDQLSLQFQQLSMRTHDNTLKITDGASTSPKPTVAVEYSQSEKE